MAGERIEASGMRVVARNVRTQGGEIDIIAEDGEDLVFVEVRTRRGVAGGAAESVDAVKLERMWQCAADYCEANGIEPERMRVDVVSVDLGRAGRGPFVVEHFRAVEMAD
jgi:putative endonuclease